jgi:hypothetical protein
MSANPTRIRFRRKVLSRDSADAGISSTCFNVAAAARRGALRQLGRPILVCRWVAVDGRLECRWSIEVSEGSSLEEPKSSRVHRIGCFFDVKRSRYRQAVPAAA